PVPVRAIPTSDTMMDHPFLRCWQRLRRLGGFVRRALEDVLGPDSSRPQPGSGCSWHLRRLEDRKLRSIFPLAGEFRVNTYTPNSQWTLGATPQNVARNANGSFVATWSSYGQDGDGWG